MGLGGDYIDLILKRQTISDSNAKIFGAELRFRARNRPFATLTLSQISGYSKQALIPSPPTLFVRPCPSPPSPTWPNTAARPPAARRLRRPSWPWCGASRRTPGSGSRPASLRQQTAELLEANAADIAAAPGFGLTDAQIDRLRLNPKRIEEIAVGLEQVAAAARPGRRGDRVVVRPNGLEILKVRVPLGVVFFIYESRPNVTADAAAICVKSGNAVILRGGKEAAHSSRAIVESCCEAAAEHGLPGRRRAAGRDDRPRRRGPFPVAAPSTSTWPFRAAAKA